MTLLQQGLSPINASGAERVHGPSCDTDEGSDKRIFRSDDQQESYGRMQAPYGTNNLGHHLGQFAASWTRMVLFSNSFVQTVYAAIYETDLRN